MEDKPISILLVEDDNDINNMLYDLLESCQYQITRAYSGTEALLHLKNADFHLCILDWMLPGMDGKAVLQEIRAASNLPVIGISAKVEVENRIDFIKSGADDYLTKPFHNDELLVRIEALLRRNQVITGQQQSVLSFHDLTLDQSNLEVRLNHQVISLTKREYLILELLMSNPNKIFTKNNIYESVWNEEFIGEDNAVNVHISNIRQKLAKAAPDQKYIQTVWGIGFKMQSE